MEVIGIRETSFTTADNKTISGVNIYVKYPLDKGIGDGAERIFMTNEKLNKCGYTPAVGDDIRVMYNKYGKAEFIEYV